MKISFSTMLLAAATGLSFVGTASVAMADSTAYTIQDTTGQGLGNGPFTLGFAFIPTVNMDVTAIGIFDDNQDGLVDSYVAGIFDSAGSLLGSTVISNGTVDPLTNQFRYASMTPVSLIAGNTYEIGAVYHDSNDPLIFPGAATGFATDPNITFVENRYIAGGSLVAPMNTAGTDPAYFGPNFMFTSSAVPEPGTVALGLMLAGSSLGLITRRRNRK